MLNVYVRHGITEDKVHELLSLKQNKWLKTYKSFNTQKRFEAIFDFEKEIYRLMHFAFLGKTMENVRNRKKNKIYFIR